MSNYTATQKAIAVDRIASRRDGFTALGEGYAFGVVSRPENLDDLTPEQIRDQTVWGVTAWDENKLGTPPTIAEIEEEAGKPTVPNQISSRQIRLALIAAGKDPDAIAAAINQIEDEAQRKSAIIEWEYASHVERQHPMIAVVGALLGMTESEVDAIFEAGAKM